MQSEEEFEFLRQMHDLFENHLFYKVLDKLGRVSSHFTKLERVLSAGGAAAAAAPFSIVHGVATILTRMLK